MRQDNDSWRIIVSDRGDRQLLAASLTRSPTTVSLLLSLRMGCKLSIRDVRAQPMSVVSPSKARNGYC